MCVCGGGGLLTDEDWVTVCVCVVVVGGGAAGRGEGLLTDED